MKANNLYGRAHLFVAAIRILAHQQAAPPSLEKICNLLSISLEEGNRLCRKLTDLGAVGVVEKTGEARLFIKDHVKIEEIPRGPETSGIEAELKRYREEKEAHRKTLEDIRALQAEKKKKLHEALEKKLKGDLKPSG